jgi:hypothetical protein
MSYRVSYRDIDGIKRERIFEATAADTDLGEVIMDWVDEELGVDSQTDGTDVWYEKDGEQVTVMSGMEIEEV